MSVVCCKAKELHVPRLLLVNLKFKYGGDFCVAEIAQGMRY